MDMHLVYFAFNGIFSLLKVIIWWQFVSLGIIER